MEMPLVPLRAFLFIDTNPISCYYPFVRRRQQVTRSNERAIKYPAEEFISPCEGGVPVGRGGEHPSAFSTFPSQGRKIPLPRPQGRFLVYS